LMFQELMEVVIQVGLSSPQLRGRLFTGLEVQATGMIETIGAHLLVDLEAFTSHLFPIMWSLTKTVDLPQEIIQLLPQVIPGVKICIGTMFQLRQLLMSILDTKWSFGVT